MDKSYLNHLKSISHLEAVDHADIPKAFAENISKLRTDHKLTQDDMAYILGIGKQTYVRIEAGTNAGINAEIAIKASNLFHVPVMSLFGFKNTSVDAYKNYMKCTERTQRLLQSLMDADLKMQDMFTDYDPKDMITVLTFTDEIHDGMIVSRFLHHEENISSYKRFSWYKDAHCLLQINSNAYHPLYHYGDKLVICNRAPLDGETGVFFKGSEFYLRKNKHSPESTYLTPVTYYENMPVADIIVDRRKPEDMRQYTKFGTVIAVI